MSAAQSALEQHLRLWAAAYGSDLAVPEGHAAPRAAAPPMPAPPLREDAEPEPLGGAHRDQKGAIALVRAQLEAWLDELKALPTEALMAQRYEKFRHMGTPVEV